MVIIPTIVMKIGYAKAELTLAFISSSSCRNCANRLRVSSKTPPSSPERIIFIYKAGNSLGYLLNESVRVLPSFNSRETEDIIFLLWGRHAQSFSKIISPVKHHLLFAGHPSPLNTKDKFEGCNHFNQANEILIENGKQPIIW